MPDLIATLSHEKIIAVLTIDDPDNATPVAQALWRGGVRAMELTLRTPAALEALIRIRREVPEMLVGAGTVLEIPQLKAVAEAGASFAVSPGTNPEILREAASMNLPFAPGVMTPTDIDFAIREGSRLLKFFPAGSSGGLPHLKNIAAPFAHLNPRFIPLGGINAQNLVEYLSCPLVCAVGGSWLAPSELIREQNFDAIEENARSARRVIDESF